MEEISLQFEKVKSTLMKHRDTFTVINTILDKIFPQTAQKYQHQWQPLFLKSQGTRVVEIIDKGLNTKNYKNRFHVKHHFSKRESKFY